MKYTKIKLFSGNGVAESLSNLQIYPIVQLYDAIEDAEDSKTLCKEINKVSKIYKFSVDRTTANYIRLKSVDRLGNIDYLQIITE